AQRRRADGKTVEGGQADMRRRLQPRMPALVYFVESRAGAAVERAQRHLDRGRGAFRHADIDEPLSWQHVDMRVRVVAAVAQRPEKIDGLSIDQCVTEVDDARAAGACEVAGAAFDAGSCGPGPVHVRLELRVAPRAGAARDRGNKT